MQNLRSGSSGICSDCQRLDHFDATPENVALWRAMCRNPFCDYGQMILESERLGKIEAGRKKSVAPAKQV